MSELNDASRKHWYRNQSRQARAFEDADWRLAYTLHNETFEAGATWMLHTMTELSPYVQRFVELLIVLGVRDENENI